MNAAEIAAGQLAYLEASAKEQEVCPHCETWLLSECLYGRGCPTPDGVNGAEIRAGLSSDHDRREVFHLAKQRQAILQAEEPTDD